MHWRISKKGAQLLVDLHHVFNDTHKTRGKSFVYGYAHSPMGAFDEKLLHILHFMSIFYLVALHCDQLPTVSYFAWYHRSMSICHLLAFMSFISQSLALPFWLPSPPFGIGSSSGEPTTHNVSDSCRGLDYNTQFINRRAKQTLHLLVHFPCERPDVSSHPGMITRPSRMVRQIGNGGRNLLNLASLAQLNPTPKKK